MKKNMPLEGLRWSRDSGSALCDTSQNSRSRTGWGGERRENGSMDKKEKSINSHIGKAIGYSDKAHYELQTALNIALEGKGLSDEEKELLSVDFATGPEEAVERVADGSCNDEHTSAWDSSIRDCRISEVYRMTGEQIREYFNL